MNITKKAEGSKLIVTLDGRLDTNTSPELEKELEDCLDGITELEFDFKDLAYISSAGLRVMLSTQKIMKKQGKMSLHNVNDDVIEILEVTGFSDFLDINP